MKTQIIQLNQNDDLVSVKDKMSSCQTGRILLVWPSQGRVLNRQLDLNLLKRYAVRLSTQLGLATHDAEVRFYAQDLGIPVFNEIRQAQEKDWGLRFEVPIKYRPRAHLPKRDSIRKSINSNKPPWLELPAVRALCLGISLLALVALGIFFLPGARVTLTPQKEVQSIKLDLTADPSATTYNLSTGIVPTYSQETTVVGTDTITTTGTISFPDKPAAGMLKFTNSSKGEINLPAGTIVTTLGLDQVCFVTTSADDLVIKPGKSVFVEAAAIKPGSSGNLSPNRLVAIEGQIGLEMKVTNPEATSGGVDAFVPSPSVQDLQSVRERLSARLIREALIEFQSNLPREDSLIQPFAKIIEVLEETYNTAIGEPAERVELTLRLKIGAQAVSGEVLRSMVIPILDSNIPNGYAPVINTLVITPLGSPTLDATGKAYWTVNVKRELLAEIPTSRAVESVKGATVSEAVERLSGSIPLAEDAHIKVIPSWWPRLPFLTMRITFVQVDPQ